MAANPYIVSNRNRYSIAVKNSSFGFKPMSSCVDANIRTYQTIVTDMNFCHIKHRAIVVGMEIVAYMDVLSKVAVKIVTYEGIDAY